MVAAKGVPFACEREMGGTGEGVKRCATSGREEERKRMWRGTPLNRGYEEKGQQGGWEGVGHARLKSECLVWVGKYEKKCDSYPSRHRLLLRRCGGDCWGSTPKGSR